MQGKNGAGEGLIDSTTCEEESIYTINDDGWCCTAIVKYPIMSAN